MRMHAHVAVLALLLAAGTTRAEDYLSMTGPALYMRFCASCHGPAGRGDGPVAGTLRVEVPDLTLLARRAGGTYPRERVVRVIDGRHTLAAHGSRIMPVWGEDLGRHELGNPNAERTTRTLLARLADYVWLLQKPAAD